MESEGCRRGRKGGVGWGGKVGEGLGWGGLEGGRMVRGKCPLAELELYLSVSARGKHGGVRMF